MIQRITQRLRRDFGPLLEFFPIGSVTGDEAFIHARRTQGPPFVMVAFEPDSGQILETPIFGNILRRQMTVVIDDRHFGREIVIKPNGFVGLEQEVGSDEWSHG